LGPDGTPDAPIPGVIVPSTPGNEVGVCGVGASGTGCCFCARIPELVTSQTVRSAASVMALLWFTAISSPCCLPTQRKRSIRPHLTEYQTRQKPAGCSCWVSLLEITPSARSPEPIFCDVAAHIDGALSKQIQVASDGRFGTSAASLPNQIRTGSRAGCMPPKQDSRYALLEVEFSSNSPECFSGSE
jgi:hypothetical protein